MDKYEYKVRADEIKELIAMGDYPQAAEIADTIDWRRVKSVMMLCTISDLYKINRRYEDAKNMLLLAYERRPEGRTICYSLCELCIKTEEFVQAVNYYKEFVQVAPKDSGRYILQYKLYEAQDVSLEERIGVLEELKKRDYREKWAYELAYLYHRVGLATRCVEECDELILWFGEGKYVVKALELKMLHEPLTAEQQAKYDNRFGTAEAEIQEPEQAPEQNVVYPEESAISDADAAQSEAAWSEGAWNQTAGSETMAEMPAESENFGQQAAEEQSAPEELDIQVKTMDVGEYNTINLQAELAEGLREVLGKNQARDAEITRTIIEPLMNSDTETLDFPEIDEVDEEDLGPEAEEMESSEVFFGETVDLSAAQSEKEEVFETEDEPQVEEILAEEAEAVAQEAEVPAPQGVRELTSVQEGDGFIRDEVVQEKTVTDETAEIVLDQMRMETEEVLHTEEEAMTAQPPEQLARVLSQESDGQIRLVMPDSEQVEKQITGQMSIEDILTEWERMKKENEEKRREEVRRRVLQQTGTMFTEFEAAVRDGLLEQLEQGVPIETVLASEAATGVAETVTETVEEAATEVPVTEEIAEEVTEEELVTEEFETEEIEEVEEAAEEESVAEEPAYEEPEYEEAEPEYEEAAYEEAETEEFETEEIEEIEEVTEEESETEEFETEEIEEVEEVMEEDSEEEAPESEEEPETEETEDPQTSKPQKPVAKKTKAEKQAPVEREKARVRSLTREEKELFAPFIQSRSARESLVKAIDNISMAAYTGNIIITGDEGMDTITLAKNMIREVQMTDSNFSGKVAKITGEGLNKKNLEETLARLSSGALIIQKASDIKPETAASLHKALQQENFGIIIVLEDVKKAMNKLLAENVDFAESFTARVDVEALSNDTLVAFGKQYAREMEYSIDELGVLALHTRIEELQTIDHAVTVVEVKEIVDAAIHHANRKTLGHFFDILFAKRYDDEDMIILTEKDFV